jgi:hypothetical protein
VSRDGVRTVVAVCAGLASVATMPVAVYATRWSADYDLLHSAIAIPLGLALGLLAVRLSVDRGEVSLAGSGRSRAAYALGLTGIWLAGAALVAVAFYGLLTYLGNRD